MNDERGSIRNLAAYLKAKMLNHSGWAKILPRKITASDVDMIFDNNGDILMVELKPDSGFWRDVQYGQRTLYTNLVLAGQGKITCVCAKHNPVDGEIDTTKDIRSFQVMRYQDGRAIKDEIQPGTNWVDFVKDFFERKK